MTPVVLIGCSASKLDRAAPARELYTGRVFKASVAYAEATGAKWCVLSALHGVVAHNIGVEIERGAHQWDGVDSLLSEKAARIDAALGGES